MKKTYTKPEIIFESFALSTNIAGDCDRYVDTFAKDSCAIKGSAPGTDLFSSSIAQCDIDGDLMDGAVNDGFCYHVPDASHQLFNS